MSYSIDIQMFENLFVYFLRLWQNSEPVIVMNVSVKCAIQVNLFIFYVWKILVILTN